MIQVFVAAGLVSQVAFHTRDAEFDVVHAERMEGRVGRLLQIAKRSPGDLEQRISIGSAVDTTANAIETAAWARQQGIASIRLVTAAYHMPRSLLEFRQAMPMATIVPHPVFPESVKQLDWWAWPGTAALVISEYNKFLLAWARHRAAEWFKGEPAAKSSVQPATN